MTAVDFGPLQTAVESRPLLDTFAWVRRATDSHRRRHGCWAYAYADGTVLGAVAAWMRPDAVLELGTALGYTSCWWAIGGGRVDTVENDPEHVELAREHLSTAGLAGRVTVHEGDFTDVLAQFTGPYDLAFFDGYEPTAEMLETVGTLVRTGGALVTTNLGLGGGFRQVLAKDPSWSTHFLDHDTAFSIRLSGRVG